jgi:hypothetical protein
VAARPDAGRARRRGLVALGAGALALAALGLWLGRSTPRSGLDDAGAVATARDAAVPLARAGGARDAGAPLARSVPDAGERPDRVRSAPARDAAATRVVNRRPLPLPPQPPRVDATAGYGWLDLNAEPWAQVAVDGVPIQRHTPLRDFALPSGSHRITLHNPVFDLTHTILVEIRAGERVQRSVDLTAR